MSGDHAAADHATRFLGAGGSALTLLQKTMEDREKYRNLVEDINAVVFATDQTGQIIYVSPLLHLFTGFHPEDCIDCGVCEPECPVDAIKPDSQDSPDGKWLKVNTEFSKVWPNITRKGTAPADADDFKDQQGKFEKYFSSEPGSGD